jgi:hypothetical protein
MGTDARYLEPSIKGIQHVQTPGAEGPAGGAPFVRTGGLKDPWSEVRSSKPDPRALSPAESGGEASFAKQGGIKRPHSQGASLECASLVLHARDGSIQYRPLIDERLS